jgi:phosphoribosylformylglycinamidine synthase
VKAQVVVTLKSEVLDPQGKAIGRAAESLGYKAIRDVRQGKFFEIEVDTPDRAAAERIIEELAEKLLSNPVIEGYRILDITS